MKAKPVVPVAPVELVRPHCPSSLFLRDAVDGANLYDAEPFSTYQLAGTDGEVDYSIHSRVAIKAFRFNDGQHFERALMRMLFAVTKHVRRFVTVVAGDAHRFLPGPTIFAGPRAKRLFPSVKDALDAPGLPEGIVLSIAQVFPEDFGRIISRGNEHGAALFAPHLLTAVEIVPAPWGHREAPAERLPPIE